MANLTYAKCFGSTFGASKPQKLHYTNDGHGTLCGLACYGSSKIDAPWTAVCGRCERIMNGVKRTVTESPTTGDE